MAKGSFQKNEASVALEEIYGAYPKLTPKDVEQFAPVYYPIALIEMDLEEQTFEDFESVQLAVLRLANLGITSPQVIADTLGLSPKYTANTCHLLTGYGHLNENGITEIGRQSVVAGKKITQSRVWQRFQIDGLNGTLLRLDRTVIDTIMTEKDQTRSRIGHLDHLDGMPVQEITSQLLRRPCEEFIKQKSGILNANVRRVNEVRLVEMKYAKCYMMKIRRCPTPVIFAKRYNCKAKEMRERFLWAPFSVPDKSLLTRWGMDEDIAINTSAATGYVNQLYALLQKRAVRVDLSEEMEMILNQIYPFDMSGVEMIRPDEGAIPAVYLSAQALPKYRNWVGRLLLGLNTDGEYLITHERLYGGVISLRTKDPQIKKAARLLRQNAEVSGKAEVLRALREKWKGYEGEENAIRLLLGELKEVEKPEAENTKEESVQKESVQPETFVTVDPETGLCTVSGMAEIKEIPEWPGRFGVRIPTMDVTDSLLYVKERGVVYTKNHKQLLFVDAACSSLTIHPNTERIGTSAARGNENLTELVIPGHVKRVDLAAFMSCRNLRKLTLMEGIEVLECNAFSGTAIESVVIPDSVQQISVVPGRLTYVAGTFSRCQKLKQVTVGKGIEEAGPYTFYRCPIESIHGPESVRKKLGWE